MQITIADKKIAKLVADMVETSLFDNYDPNVIKTANLPSKADIVKEVLKDEVFLKSATKYLTNYITDMDVVYDAITDAKCPTLDRYERVCRQSESAYEAKVNERQQQAEIKRMIALLTVNGYDVVKKPQPKKVDGAPF